eukprot:5603878-Amphidinium_carterae.1
MFLELTAKMINAHRERDREGERDEQLPLRRLNAVPQLTPGTIAPRCSSWHRGRSDGMQNNRPKLYEHTQHTHTWRSVGHLVRSALAFLKSLDESTDIKTYAPKPILQQLREDKSQTYPEFDNVPGSSSTAAACMCTASSPFRVVQVLNHA